MIPIFFACNGEEPGPDPDPGFERSYHFDGTMQENVLRSYLSRAIVQAEVCTPDRFLQDGQTPLREDDERMLLNLGAKHIGRSAFLWARENYAADPGFFSGIQSNIKRLHQEDSELLFQACIFEVITTSVNQVAVPPWVFEAFNLPVEERKFSYDQMINENGTHVGLFAADASVPDVSRQETRMWFYFMAKQYIDAGIEAIHWGQVELIAMEDKKQDFAGWSEILEMVREYGKINARRHWVLCDGHMPSGGITVEGRLLFDYHSFPIRAREKPYSPQECELVNYHLDAFYGRSKGGITPSGWECESLPYLVEFDNGGISDHPGQADVTSTWMWGYDEISWFAVQPEEYRNEFLEYAWERVRDLDQAGYLQMPGNRVIIISQGSAGRYRANTKTTEFPFGFSQEETIRTIWNSDAIEE
ncbi:MAG: hypothetical protein ABFS10_05905 [Bacteroidota bacterium]